MKRFVIAALLLLGACGPRDPAVAVERDLSAVETEIRSIVAAQVRRRGDFQADLIELPPEARSAYATAIAATAPEEARIEQEMLSTLYAQRDALRQKLEALRRERPR